VAGESEWCEVDDDGLGFSGEDDVEIGKVGGSGSTEAWALVRVLAGQNKDLFRANVSVVRAAGWLLRESISGQVDRFNADAAKLEQMGKMAGQLADLKMEIASAEGDSEELKEFGKTARKWMEMAHEDKLAEKGIRTPMVPKTRIECARALRSSLTMAQLDTLSETLGPDRADMLAQLLKNASAMTEDQLAAVIDGLAGDLDQKLQMMEAMSKVFSDRYVPTPWAIFQTRCFTVIVEGAAEEEAA